jgi:histidine triad (HIT) family protein
MSHDCLFCKISDGEIKAELVYEDENLLAFHDIHQQAPTHLIIIPRKHIATVNDISDEDTFLVAEMIKLARNLAKKFHHKEDGYRLIMNCNEDGGQTIFHIHLHLLAGREMGWPPG